MCPQCVDHPTQPRPPFPRPGQLQLPARNFAINIDDVFPLGMMKCCSWKCRVCAVFPSSSPRFHRPRQLVLPTRKIVESISAAGTLFRKSSNISLQQALSLKQSCHCAAKLCKVTFDCHISPDAWLQACSYHCLDHVCRTLEVPPVN